MEDIEDAEARALSNGIMAIADRNANCQLSFTELAWMLENSPFQVIHVHTVNASYR